MDLLRQASITRACCVPEFGPAVDDAKVAEQVEIETKYAGYLNRQRDEIARQQRNEATTITHFDYAHVRGLSAEVLQKLQRVQPQTVGQAQLSTRRRQRRFRCCWCTWNAPAANGRRKKTILRHVRDGVFTQRRQRPRSEYYI